MLKKLLSKISKYLPQILALLFILAFAVYGWTEPGSAPPGGNVDAPVNVGSVSQIKSGALQVNGFRNLGSTILDNAVRIGTTTAATNLNVYGTTTIMNGNVGIGTTIPAAALDLPGGTTGRASLRIRSGVGPTTPNAGDIWSSGNDIFFHKADGTIVRLLSTALSVPSSLSATAVSYSQINLAWIDNSDNETGFQIQRCTGIGCDTFALVFTAAANATSWSNTGLSGNTLYRYRVRTVWGGSGGDYSNIDQATTWSFILNSASGLTCTQVCNNIGRSCTSIGFNYLANDGYYSYIYESPGGHGQCGAALGSCTTTMGPYSGIFCGGTMSPWTRCNCGW